MSENTEVVKSSSEQVTPVPAAVEAVATAPANGTVSAPAVSPAEKQDAKITAAFIKQRQENKELKARLAAAPVAVPPSPVVEQAPVVAPVVPPAPAPVTAVNGIAELEKQAMKSLADDKDIASIPGATIEILSMIDADDRLSRLYSQIDPILAIREAKALFLEKAGITAAPAIPVSAPTSGGMSGGSVNLETLIAECEKHLPGTKEFNSLAKKIQAEMGRLHKL